MGSGDMDIDEIIKQHQSKIAGITERVNDRRAQWDKQWQEYESFCNSDIGKADSVDLADPYSAASKKAEAEKAKKKGRYDL